MSSQNFSMASGPTTLSGPAYLWNQARQRLLENCLSEPSDFTLQIWGWVKLQHRQKSVRQTRRASAELNKRLFSCSRNTTDFVYLVILHLCSWSSGSFLFFTGIMEPLLDLTNWASHEKKQKCLRMIKVHLSPFHLHNLDLHRGICYSLKIRYS